MSINEEPEKEARVDPEPDDGPEQHERPEPHEGPGLADEVGAVGGVTTEVQTEMSSRDIDALMGTSQKLQEKKTDLENKVSDLELDQKSFEDNDEKVKTFTGLTKYTYLLQILVLISPNLKKNVLLSPFQQLLLTLMRIRLNATVKYLSYVFKVHHSTVVRYFTDVIHILNEKFVPLVLFWPPPSEISPTLPYIFTVTFPKCISIIDCFEIFIERPSNFEAKANTYSHYKSHNTVKYLISIAPQGFVNFISKGWGGRTSDKHLTENCGYLNYLLPGDTVLADRGFTLKDSVAMYGAKLEIPAFTKGKAQLSSSEVNQTRHIASVRIHIERVIGNIRKKYSILDSTIPITLLQTDDSGFTTLDKIVRVACALSNVCESIVPFD